MPEPGGDVVDCDGTVDDDARTIVVLVEVFRTRDLPRGDRFEFWYQMSRDSILPTIIRAENLVNFQATTRILDLAPVQATQMAFPRIQVIRPPKLVRRSDPEQCFVSLVLQGDLELTQVGRHATPGVGDLLFFDSSHPFESWCSGRFVTIRFPRAIFPYPSVIDRFICTSLPDRDGMRGLVAAYMLELLKLRVEHRPTAAALGITSIDLVATLLAHSAEESNSLPPESRQRALVARIRQFIQQHLSDPDLSPTTIAAAHHISTRYLHKLFHLQDLTVAGWIRQRRLERCRTDLAEVRQQCRPVHVIAARWGFKNVAHFSRLFRTAYGMSATDYRQRARLRQDHMDVDPGGCCPESIASLRRGGADRA